MENPVDLPLRLEGDPRSVPGCAHCDTVAMDRDHAEANGDGSRMSDCNVRLSRHLADAHR
ncbi:hypothetical protein OG887_12630 [Streptomyces sp. NBC_00053]|uniref:hypothetical protein n=1 Tax=unclassified Streptomyces TaxID=2593676 RepID=UPI000F5BF541|nr:MULTISPECIES: hypothetical protein [unclassified Streptomyces]WSG50555.1 hypothetical protein OHA38_12495 [Streptomyces sp. NBC_01732]WSX01211.1 hypothetical protein OG355_12630 [Streptomyces sp. NBC_00987]MCX5500220.1 hypothetical protein [Streptomyces sp. NBC_00052]MCX5551245.1 hypothetical protein [Streptomyces sp. NBC_00051]RPK73052.1 hypothetical protein EES42_10825 [Streptomyces sp. ADI95-17]